MLQNKHEYNWVKTRHGSVRENNTVCLLEMTADPDLKFEKYLRNCVQIQTKKLALCQSKEKI